MGQLVSAFPPGGAVVEREVDPGEVDDLRSTVTIGRTHPSDCGQRQIFARLDDHSRVTLAFGDSVTMEVLPGRHRLRVHNTLFWKTIDFAIEPAERLEFQVINTARWWTYGMAGVLGSAPLFLTVRKFSVV
jgi:hypothetical protein